MTVTTNCIPVIIYSFMFNNQGKLFRPTFELHPNSRFFKNLFYILIRLCGMLLLAKSNQNDEITVYQSIKPNNVDQEINLKLSKEETRKRASLNCLTGLCCSFGRKKEEVTVNPELFDAAKMSNPFKSNENVSKSSSSSTLSSLVVKPIKSLNSNATGSGKTKVELKPGRSLMDWIRLTNSDNDLTCNSFGQRKVTGTELATHNKLDDAWTCIQGTVFNITPYFEYHPGGRDELLRAAGKDATQLFKQVHAWVNYNSMLQKCKVGHLITGDDVVFADLDKKEEKVNKTIDFKSPTTVAFDEKIFEKNFIVLTESDSLYDMNIKDKKYRLNKPTVNLNEYQLANNELQSAHWSESMDEFYLCFKFEKEVKDEDLMIDLTQERMIKVKVYLLEKICYIFNCELPGLVKQITKFYIEGTSKLTITLEKSNEELWAGQLNSEKYQFELLNQSISNSSFRRVKLIEKKSLTPDVRLFTFQMPSGLYMPIRFGNHVALRLTTNELFRYYTVVPKWFIDKKSGTNEHYERSNKFCFIIKIYSDGQFTSKLNKVKVGNQIEVSDVFSIDEDIQQILTKRKTIYLLAAGTGITPMLSVLFLARLTEMQESSEIKLIFCNKTEQDIILKDEFEQLTKRNDLGFKFSYVNILSRPSANWTGLKGRISEAIMKELVKFDDAEFMFLCGPDEFNISALNILDTLYRLNEESYYIFSS